ncbi:GSCOCG00010320001-RA-CDS, partial [Cotesia congregata]
MFSDKFSIFIIFFGFFSSILAGNNAEASGIVNLSGKDFGNFDVLNVKINNQNGESESKKIIVNIDNLNLTVDSTKGGIWVYLKSQTNYDNKYYKIPKVSVDPSSEKVYNLDTKSLSSFNILNITLSPDVTSPESKKKINVIINDMVVVLDTRNYIALSMKSTKDINNNYNNMIINGNGIFIGSNNNNNNGIFFSTSNINNINTHFHWDGTSFSNFNSEGDNFDKEEFEDDMNEMQEDMKTMGEDMRRDALFDREEFQDDMNE